MFLVSACLAGYPCRYNGSDCSNKIVQDLVNSGKAVPICPEQLAGLPTPRSPCELKTDANGNQRVIGNNNYDYTEAYKQAAERTLALCVALGLKEALFKSKSPSCGCGQIYDGTFSGKAVSGDGVTTALLKKNGIQVKTEEDLVSPLENPKDFFAAKTS